MSRTITIVCFARGGFDIHEGERYSGLLSFDEMLGEVVRLTHPQLGDSHYGMLTPEEHAARFIRTPADFSEVTSKESAT